jgi:hypothetical protein
MDPTKHNNFFGYVDADWASDMSHRKSVTGIIIVAHSSTEAEFAAACEAANMTFFIRSIFQDLDLEQPDATILYEDNNGALMMANAQQPTQRTRHIDMKMRY